MMKSDKEEQMTGSELASGMKTEFVGRTLYCYQETTSTNEDARRLALENAPDGTLVVAETQTKGRGRRGRSWESPAGRSIYFSLLLRPECPSHRTSMLTLVMALSVAEAIERIAGDGAASYTSEEFPARDVQVSIKWPNDLVMNGRKVCGILTELILDAEAVKGVIIGVGVNVNQRDASDFPEAVREYAGSVHMACGREISRIGLLAEIMYIFEKNYKTFLRTCDMSVLKPAYQSHLANMDRQVRVLDPKGEYTGVARGINPLGELQVERSDGTIAGVYAGEVSVRGLYGYV